MLYKVSLVQILDNHTIVAIKFHAKCRLLADCAFPRSQGRSVASGLGNMSLLTDLLRVSSCLLPESCQRTDFQFPLEHLYRPVALT